MSTDQYSEELFSRIYLQVTAYADFVVLDKDVLELEKTNKLEIFNTNVESTGLRERKFIRNKTIEQK